MLALIFIPSVIILALGIILYEDGYNKSLFNRIKCLLGKHKMWSGWGLSKTPKYYCQVCKKPRKHPVLKSVKGNKMLSKGPYKN